MATTPRRGPTNLAELLMSAATRPGTKTVEMTGEEIINEYVTTAKDQLEYSQELLKRAETLQTAMNGTDVKLFLAAYDRYNEFNYEAFMEAKNAPITHASDTTDRAEPKGARDASSR